MVVQSWLAVWLVSDLHVVSECVSESARQLLSEEMREKVIRNRPKE